MLIVADHAAFVRVLPCSDYKFNLTEQQNRGVKGILIACVDGLKGFPGAINAAFPEAKVQLCIVHMVRNSIKYVQWKDFKAVTADL